jgi:hypothetical protein
MIVYGERNYFLAGEEEPPQTIEMTAEISPSMNIGNVIYYTSAEVCVLDDDAILVKFAGNDAYYRFTGPVPE